MKKPVIICVDDEKIVLDSLKKELRESVEQKYLIEIAESAEEALEIYTELKEAGHEIPLVISDYIMPGIKGDELLQKLKDLDPSSYRIMLTGQATIEGITNAVNNADLYRYISKPWETNDLKLTVGEALKSYDREKQIVRQNNEILEQNIRLKQKSKEIIDQNSEIKQKNEEVLNINKNLDKLVKDRTKELKNTIEDLLRVNIGKKAYIILFITTIVMFLAVDVLVEPMLEDMLHNFIVLIGIKALIALLIKPIESFIEDYLFARARRKIVPIEDIDLNEIALTAPSRKNNKKRRKPKSR
ncbi:response regulator [bacterium]|nr:response regulator [bacterium]